MRRSPHRRALAWLLLAAMLAAGVGASAAQASRRVIATNRVPIQTILANTGSEGVDHCQNEHVAAGTHAISLSLRPIEGPGPAVRVAAYTFVDGMHRHPLLTGARAGGWSGDSVVVPLRHVVRRRLLASLCMSTAHGTAMTLLAGSPPGEPDGRVVRVVYLGADQATPPLRAESREPTLGGWPDFVLAVLVALVRGFTAP